VTLNDAENSALITGTNYILKYIAIENYLKCPNVIMNISLYLIK